jgi:hypothetical protein
MYVHNFIPNRQNRLKDVHSTTYCIQSGAALATSKPCTGVLSVGTSIVVFLAVTSSTVASKCVLLSSMEITRNFLPPLRDSVISSGKDLVVAPGWAVPVRLRPGRFFLFFFAINCSGRLPLELPSAMLDILFKRNFIYFRTITKRLGLSRTGDVHPSLFALYGH